MYVHVHVYTVGQKHSLCVLITYWSLLRVFSIKPSNALYSVHELKDIRVHPCRKRNSSQVCMDNQYRIIPASMMEWWCWE